MVWRASQQECERGPKGRKARGCRKRDETRLYKHGVLLEHGDDGSKYAEVVQPRSRPRIVRHKEPQ